MGRKRSFLGFLATLFVAFFTANVFAAGYTCPSYKKYTECFAGYYLNGTGVGNACKACPSNWTSAAGATAQSQCYRNIVLNKNGGSGKLSGTNVTDSSGGTANASIKCFYGTACSFPSASGLTQSGSKRYAGWSTSSSNSSSTTQKFTITSTASTVTYYAARRPIYTITLNNQSATSAGTTAVYEVHGDGIYLNSALTQVMTTTAYPITVPTKTGYTFGGYYTQTGGSGVQMISANGRLTSSFTPTSFSVAGNLYAKWMPNTYKVTLNKQDGTDGTSEYYYQYNTLGSCYYYKTSALSACIGGTKGDSITVPIRNGYTFGGYYTGTNGTGTQYVDADGGTTGNLYSTSAKDITLYAKWTQCTACSAGTGASCTLSVSNNTCTYTTSCKDGYNTLTNDGKYNPSCTANTYTVKYNANGGSGTTTASSHTYNAPKTLTANGFTNGTKSFLGWSTSSTATSATYTNKQEVTNLTATSGGTVDLYAVWKECTACNAGTGASCTLTAPSGVCTYTTRCKDGYSSLQNDGKYNPSCTLNSYTITINKNGGSGSLTVNGETATGTTNVSFTCTHGTTFTMPAWDGSANALTKSNSTFTGWSASGTITCDSTKTITAKWENCTAASKGTGVASSSLTGVTSNVCRYTHNCSTGYWNASHGKSTTASSITCEQCPEDYRNIATTAKNSCVGTFQKTGIENACSQPNNSKSYTCASCNPETCDYTKNYAGTTISDCTPTNCKQDVASYTCKQDFYKNNSGSCSLCGDYSSTSDGNTSTTCTCDQGYSADGTQNGTKTTTSAACKAIVYNISYTMNSGTNYSGAPTTYTYGVGATINGTPTRTGYTFVGWCTNYDLTENCAETKTISATDLGDKIFYAKWTAKQYKVEYSCGDGTGTPPTNGTATYNQNFTPAANTCTRSGYTFNGWNDGSTTHAAGTAFKWTYTSDKTFTATWKLNGAIDIKYNTNGGTINNYGDAVACNAASAAFALPTNVTRAGYTFGGWYNNSNLTGTAITTVSAGTCTGQLEYWAKWTACNSTTDGACNCASGTYPSNGTCTNCSKSCSGVSGYTQGTYNVCNSETTDLCYRACVPSDINGATVVTGTITKGGVNTCVATTCDAEYFKQGDGCAKCPDNAETCGGGDDSWECDTGYEKSASGTACNAKKYTVTLDNQGATTAGTKSITATYNQKLGTITAPTKTDYAFGGYCTDKNGAGTCYYNASGVGVLAWNIDSNTTLYANWILDVFTCTAGKATDGTACTPGYYCPGGKVNADVKNDTTSGCERKCPSATGKTVNSQAGASASTQCYASGTVDIYESTNTTVTGKGTKTCNWNGEDSYNASCNIVPTSCIGGYYRPADYNPAGTSACEQADSGYYSPDGDLLQKQCPQKTNYTIGTDVVRDAEADCYVVCDSYVPGVENADKVYVTAGAEYQKMFYKNGAYSACQYTVECKTGYDAVSGATPQCKAKTYAITLNKNGGSGNIAETVNCTFNGNDCALPATSVLKRDGYNTANKWCTNADGTGACYEADKVVSGNVSANGTDTQLYAIWTPAVFKIELSAPDADTNAAQGPVYLKYATGWYSDANASQPLTTLGTQLPGKGGEAYVFAGYELNGEMIIDANGSLSVSTGALTATTKDATATAQWTKGLTKCDAGTYYPGTGSSCVACTVATNGTHPKSDAGTTDSVNDCYKVCKPYEVVNGTAVPVSDKAYYPSDCEFEGKSTNGNPCDIVDGVCVETSCNYNFEMDNGVCKPCAREHAISYKQSGNCVVESCANGYHPNEQQCEGDVVECSAPNAVVAKQTWDARKNAFGACMITECEEGYHLGANACQLDEQVCELEHGVGVREWNHKSNTWGECIATKCEPGYTSDPSLTNELWKQCGRCNNMYSANSELAVSSYVQGCEIAACMYQGELYALENNECRLICDTYSDETGSRRWNASRKKCERTCEPGYTS